MNVTLRFGYSSANTARVTAAGGKWDAMVSAYIVPDSAAALIQEDQAKFAASCKRAAKMPSNLDSTRTAGRLAGYSDAEVESALRTSGGDDL